MTLNQDLTLGSNTLCYADGTVMVDGGAMLIPINASDNIESLAGNSHILYRKPISIYTSDDYLFFDNINGFSLKRY